MLQFRLLIIMAGVAIVSAVAIQGSPQLGQPEISQGHVTWVAQALKLILQNAEALKAVSSDTLRLTAYQYNAEQPGWDLNLNKGNGFWPGVDGLLRHGCENEG